MTRYLLVSCPLPGLFLPSLSLSSQWLWDWCTVFWCCLGILGGTHIALVSWALLHGCMCHWLWSGPWILHRYPGYAAVRDGGWILVWSFHPDTHSWGWLRTGALCRVLPRVCSFVCIGSYWRLLSRHPWGILCGICWGCLGFWSSGQVSCLFGAIPQSLLFHPRRPWSGSRLPGGWLRSWLWRLPWLLHLLLGICHSSFHSRRLWILLMLLCCPVQRKFLVFWWILGLLAIQFCGC